MRSPCVLTVGRVLACAILWIPAGWTATMLVKLGNSEPSGAKRKIILIAWNMLAKNGDSNWLL